MKGKTVIKKITSMLMIGILFMTLFLPAFSSVKRDFSRNSTKKVLRAFNKATDGKTQLPSSMSMMEEEEEEYMPELKEKPEIHLPVFIAISFHSPNLFFNEHFVEVSGPPPWS